MIFPACFRSLMFALLSGLLMVPLSAFAAKTRLSLCAEQNLYPFVFLDGYKASGIFVDMAEAMEEMLNIKIRVRPMEWNQCLDFNKEGKVDGILGAGFTTDRAVYMEYPGSSTDPDTTLGIWSPSYTVVTTRKQNYSYNGDPRSIPQPIRVPTGYFIAKVLRADGVQATEMANSDQANLITMSAEKSGSVVMLALLADTLAKKTFFEDGLAVSKMPYKVTNFYVPFSRSSTVSSELKESFWQALKEVRAKDVFIRSSIKRHLQKDQ